MPGYRKLPLYQTIDGVQCPMFDPDCIREALNYKARPGDVFITTYPKCGTTWMQYVALHIFRKGRELEDPQDFHRLCPFIEARGTKWIETLPRPPAYKTHFPYTHIPYSPEAKYVYALRNPKDCCVSMYHHLHETHFKDDSEETTFDDFFEKFMAGEVNYGDYFDHLASWYPHLKDEQVFFTTYEDMKKDLRAIVLRLASFLGKEYSDAIEKDNSVLNNILRFSSIEYMKKNYTEFGHREESGVSGEDKECSKPPKNFHIRKGVVGDWKNHFSPEQSERLSRKFKERTEGTEIFERYRTFMG